VLIESNSITDIGRLFQSQIFPWGTELKRGVKTVQVRRRNHYKAGVTNGWYLRARVMMAFEGQTDCMNNFVKCAQSSKTKDRATFSQSAKI